jgi:5-deoxy-glucuronate isomerase
VALVNVMPDLGGAFAYLLRVSARSRLGMVRGRGTANGSVGKGLAWLVVEGGEGELVIGSETAEVGGREDVFDGPGWSAVLPPGTLFAVRGHLRYSIVARAWEAEAELRIQPPDEVEVELRGHGPDEREVRTYLGAGPLICGESLTQPGRWSSWPPHRHEQEEVALFRFDEPHGFGVQLLETGEGGRRSDVVTDGDARRIRAGFHAAVAAPGTRMCALWALAGTSSTFSPEPDPAFV